ncbi:DUF2889 domain-containing protein [Acidovorax temperans]|jgi:hypothetical protein|uniref:DUF2889 domain-containing protein n=1 Tax=Acidovorax temperans TaxID=80878 RepID=UPI001A94E8DB|nr:DUF2889 domain-containing protein [Acidovorax temperans]MBO0942228.1 DUF2889 domain-containing protein [Acidovorax temperans]MBP8146778.1 DUF2889 domain-containing protein [Acidovorax sp.]
MPLSAPVPRKTSHIRRVTYQGYEREDGLWDMEAELHDSKAHDMPSFRHQGVRLAGDPIHHMWLRVTIDRQLVVHAIEAAMDAHPLQDCPQARPALQGMVGACMARGWRQAIAQHMGGVASCTHLRELLFNMATAAFQTLPAAFGGGDPDTPPRHLGQCTGWDFEGNGVKEYFPQFYGRGEANTQPSTPHNPTGKKSF